jgi:hypothetical protein
MNTRLLGFEQAYDKPEMQQRPIRFSESAFVDGTFNHYLSLYIRQFQMVYRVRIHLQQLCRRIGRKISLPQVSLYIHDWLRHRLLRSTSKRLLQR